MLFLGAVLAFAQAAAAAPPSRPPTTPPPSDSLVGQCASVAVSSPQAPKKRVTFSATKILDLEFGAMLRSSLVGEHVLNLKVYTPRGHLYQQLDVPFRGGVTSSPPSPEVGTEPRMRQVEGYPQPLPEQELVATRTSTGKRSYRVSTRLPVAGTSIMASSLYGNWKVVPHLDGNLKACGPAGAFSITQ